MEIWVRARRDANVRETYFGLDRRQRGLIADIVREGQRAGEFRGDGPDDFALVLSGLLDGLGVQVTLGQPDVHRRGWSTAASRSRQTNWGAIFLGPVAVMGARMHGI